MNPFGDPQHPSGMPPPGMPPYQQPPTPQGHKMRGWMMFLIFFGIAWLGIGFFAQWYFSRQVGIQIQDSIEESTRISESIQHEVDAQLRKAGVDPPEYVE